MKILRRVGLLFLTLILVQVLSLDRNGVVLAGSTSRTIASKPAASAPQIVTWQDHAWAVRLYHDGRLEEALALLDRIYKLKLTPRQNRLARFFQGVIAVRLKRYDRAERIFAGRLPLPAGLEGYGAYFAGQTAFGKEDWAIAAKRLQTCLNRHSTGAFREQASLARAESLMRLGRTNEASALYQRLGREEGNGQADLGLGRILEGQGGISGALAAYRRAMEQAESGSVWAESQRRYEALLRKIVALGAGEDRVFELVDLLAGTWRLKECLALIDERLEAGGSQDFLDDLALEKARVLGWMDRLDEALAFSTEAAARAGPHYRPEFLKMRARCLAGLGRWEEAGAAYLEAAEASPAARGDRSRFAAGEYFFRANLGEKALEIWKGLRSRSVIRAVADDRLWISAWSHYDRGELEGAAEDFSRLKEKYANRNQGKAAFYWLGRVFERQGRETDAIRAFEETVAASCPEYYRLLASERLRVLRPGGNWVLAEGSAGPALPPDFDPASALVRPSDPEALWQRRSALIRLKPTPHGSTGLNQALTRARTLAEAGTLDLALPEAEAAMALTVKEARVKPRGLSRDRLRQRREAIQDAQVALAGFIAACYESTDRHFLLARLAGRRSAWLSNGEDEDEGRLQFMRWPLVNPNTVRQEAQARDLDPTLILAVIRAESHYRHTVVSPMNAIGLMQILPSTGRRIAQELGIDWPGPEVLFEPETNIRLGAWYLGALLKEFHGQTPLALAAYNAGPFRVKRWLDQTDCQSLDAFVEQIPFDQTREYVKKILTFQHTYRQVYFGQTETLGLHRPLIKSHLDEVDF